MNQALANKPKASDKPAAELVALLERGDLSAANQLTAEMATEAKEWREPEATAKVKAWWIEQYKRRHGAKLAGDADGVWCDAGTEPQVDAATYRAELMKRLAEKAPAITEALDAADKPKVEEAKEAEEPKVEAKPEAKAPSPQPTKEPGAKALLGSAARWPDVPLPPPGASAEERLCYPAGLLGHVVQHIVDTDIFPDRRMALSGALTALAKALDRKVIGPTGSTTLLYLILLAATSAGKQNSHDCIRILLNSDRVSD
jgi:hypothetical protein